MELKCLPPFLLPDVFDFACTIFCKHTHLDRSKHILKEHKWNLIRKEWSVLRGGFSLLPGGNPRSHDARQNCNNQRSSRQLRSPMLNGSTEWKITRKYLCLPVNGFLRAGSTKCPWSSPSCCFSHLRELFVHKVHLHTMTLLSLCFHKSTNPSHTLLWKHKSYPFQDIMQTDSSPWVTYVNVPLGTKTFSTQPNRK